MRIFLAMLSVALVFGAVVAARPIPPASTIMAVAPAAGLEQWDIDPAHSSIVFSITHNNGAGLVYGRFDKFSGTIMADPAHPENSSVSVTVDATSIDTAVEPRDNDLRSEKYFNVAAFPALIFKSTAVKAVDYQPDSYELTGDFTLLGVTKPVTMTFTKHPTVTNKKGMQVSGVEAEFDIKRSDFGMTTGIPGTGDLVHVILAFECDKAGPPPPPAS